MRTGASLIRLLSNFANDLSSFPPVFCSALFLLLMLLCQCSHSSGHDVRGLVRISNNNITAVNNRNLTIQCHVDLQNRSEENSFFSTNGRMVLTFMTIPREMKPLHQIQSFLHCYDPNRTRCRAEFNFDLACLEDQMNQSYYYNQESYIVEAACQVDDAIVCSSQWMARFPFDCYDLGQIKVINAPKLSERCLYVSENKTLECGENQFCNEKFGICSCMQGYMASNGRCIVNEWSTSPSLLTETISTGKTVTDPSGNKEHGTEVARADSKGTFKAIVIFLLVLAVLLCIALGIVIIWSRHYRRLLEDLST